MATLSVPGAQLHCEARGDGPLLVLIVGGNGDSAIYGPLASCLDDRFRVVTYDRRGFVRSPVDDPVDDAARLTVDGDDALRVIEHHGGGPAHVFGSSSGAIVALDLLARHPDAVRTVVAHEPPLVTLLPDGDEWLARFDGFHARYLQAGLGPAMAEFAASIGMDGLPRPDPDGPLPPLLVEVMGRAERNMAFWFEHELRQYPRHVPDLDALAALADRIVLAVGEDSRGHLPARPNRTLAERLGLGVAELPGGHAGYGAYPVEFAARLAELLRSGR